MGQQQQAIEQMDDKNNKYQDWLKIVKDTLKQMAKSQDLINLLGNLRISNQSKLI
jgi:hypothetical protein